MQSEHSEKLSASDDDLSFMFSESTDDFSERDPARLTDFSFTVSAAKSTLLRSFIAKDPSASDGKRKERSVTQHN